MCGGYTSKNWKNINEYTADIDAFVFNMTQKYIPNNHQKAICTTPFGFSFGHNILSLISYSTLNNHDEGMCWTGKDRGYDIEGDVSPLTNQKNGFTCGELEVYKVVY